MVYELKDGTITITQENYRLYQPYNPKTKKPFKDDKDAIKWLKKQLRSQGVYAEVKVSANHSVSGGSTEVPLPVSNPFSLVIRNAETGNIERKTAVTSLSSINQTFINKELKYLATWKKYYFDVDVVGGYCLLNKDAVSL